MNKKAIAWAFIIRLTIAIILITAAVSFGASLFRQTDAATESFNRLVVKIESAKDWKKGEFDSTRLDMDEGTTIKGTAIYGFGKNSQAIERWIYRDEKDLSGNVIGWERRFHVKRFDKCEDNKVCVCLCKKVGTEEWLEKDQRDVCEKDPICHSIENIELDLVIPQLKLIFKGLEPPETYPVEIRGGFVFYRAQIREGAIGAPDPVRGLLAQNGVPPRQTQIFIEKGPGEIVGVCVAGRGSCLE